MKTCRQGNFIGWKGGGTKQKFGMLHPEAYQIIVWRVSGVLLEFPGKIVLAYAGKTGKEIQRQRLCKMLFHISDQITQIFRYRGVCFFFLGRVPEKIGKDTADTIGSQPVPAGLYGAING